MEDTDVDEEVVDVAVCPKCSKMTEHEILRRTMKVRRFIGPLYSM